MQIPNGTHESNRYWKVCSIKASSFYFLLLKFPVKVNYAAISLKEVHEISEALLMMSNDAFQ